MAKPGNTGIRRVINATFFSLAGLKTAWRSEAAFRQECVLAIVLIPVGFWLGRTAVERSLLIGACLLVLIVELLNTAVEFVIDRIGTDHHELSGHAKDRGLCSRIREPSAHSARVGPDRLGAVRTGLARVVARGTLQPSSARPQHQAQHRDAAAEQRAGCDVGRIVQPEHDARQRDQERERPRPRRPIRGSSSRSSA